MDTLDEQAFENTGAALPPEADHQIGAMAPWMRTVAIIQSVMVALSLIMNIVTVSMFSYNNSGTSGIVGAVIGIAVIIMPIIYLFQGSAAFKAYAETKDRSQLFIGLQKQKAFWKYMGILLIVYVSLMLLMLFFVLAVGGSMFRGF